MHWEGCVHGQVPWRRVDVEATVPSAVAFGGFGFLFSGDWKRRYRHRVAIWRRVRVVGFRARLGKVGFFGIFAACRSLFALCRFHLADTLHNMRTDDMALLLIADLSVAQRNQIFGLVHKGEIDRG